MIAEPLPAGTAAEKSPIDRLLRLACFGSVIREVAIGGRRSGGWFRYQPLLVPTVD